METNRHVGRREDGGEPFIQPIARWLSVRRTGGLLAKTCATTRSAVPAARLVSPHQNTLLLLQNGNGNTAGPAYVPERKAAIVMKICLRACGYREPSFFRQFHVGRLQ